MKRLPVVLAVIAVGLTLPGVVITTSLQWIDWFDGLVGVAFAAMGVGCAVTGSVVASRVPGNVVGWLVLALGLGTGVLLAAGAYAEVGIFTALGDLPGQRMAAWVGDVLGIPVFFGLTGFLLLLYPDGHLLSRRWSPLAWALGLTVAAATVSYGFAPGPIGPGVDNPLALPGDAGRLSRDVADLTDLLALPAMLSCAGAVVTRLRRSHGVERQQLKWFSYCAAVAGVGLGFAVVPAGGLIADVGFMIGLIGIVLLPVTAGVAILRYRLYDIDLVIKRTLVYAGLTAALVGTYLVLVLTLQPLLRPVAGESNLAVAASTLAVAALFRPLRSAIQRGVDRRFFRSRYDAARTLETYSERLRHELDLDSLGTELRTVVRDTMQPVHVSLWLRRAP